MLLRLRAIAVTVIALMVFGVTQTAAWAHVRHHHYHNRGSLHVRHCKRHGRTARTRHHTRRSAALLPVHAPRFAYPRDFFMWNAPPTMQAELSLQALAQARSSFAAGQAADFSPEQLVQAGVFVDDPLVGGIFRRRQKVRFIILHSTETGRPAPAPRVIKSWNRGLRHPGAQYIVDRDGVIYQTVDPQYATVHVDIFRTRFDVNNDDSIGIEIVRSGDQQYTQLQLNSVARLVAYLQERFQVDDKHIFGHHDVQPSNRFDPVGFDWTAFFDRKDSLATNIANLRARHEHPQAVGTSSHDVSQVVERGTPPVSFVDAECGNIPQPDEDI